MPLFVPATAGIDRRVYLASKVLRSQGADAVINFRGTAFDAVGDLVWVGGSDTFLGSMADITSSKIDEVAVLPSTVIGNGNLNRVRMDYNDASGQSILVQTNVLGDTARTTDRGASWSDFGVNLRAQTYFDISSWRNDGYVALTSGVNNSDFSDDLGATWAVMDTADPGPTQGASRIFTDPDFRQLIALTQNAVCVCSSDDPTVLGNWSAFNANVAFGITSGWNGGAVNGDATKGVFISITGQIVTTTDFVNFSRISVADNPYFSAGVLVAAPTSVVFVDGFDGFLIVNSLNGSQPVISFMPADGDLDTIIVGSFVGNGVDNTTVPAAVSDGANVMVVGAANEVAQTFRAG